jgi:hypothetical protein
VSNPAAARLAALLLDAITAAQVSDPARFDTALDRLLAIDKDGAGRVGSAQAGVLTALVEAHHADGLTGDDAREILEHTARTVLPWYPELDVNLLLVVLAGALGVLDPDADPYPASPADLARHATLLIAALLSPDDELQVLVSAAIGEIERAQTIEMP